MRTLFSLFLLSFTLSSYAVPVHIQCYSGKTIILDKTLDDNDIEVSEGFVLFKDKDNLTLLNAECIMQRHFKNKK